MKKLGFIFREVSENRIKKGVTGSQGVFVIKYSGLSGPSLNTLRIALRGTGAELFVVKNSVARRALQDFNQEILPLVQGPCALVFSPEPVTTSKALYTFAKENEKLVLEGGFMNSRLLARADIEFLAKLPSREVLLGQLVRTVKSPITGLVMVLKGNLRKMVFCLEQIRQKKSTAA